MHQHKITKDPIFILGFYRSGTSFLHQSMTQDDRFGYLSNFQMLLPEIMLGSEKLLSPFFDFICRIFNIRDHVHRMQLSFKYPGEEDVAMTTAFNPRGAQWGAFFPEARLEYFYKNVLFENIPESEIAAWKADYLFLLKKISLANQGKQLILKSPPNTARIKLLLSLFPNAKFILMHRNPYEVYASNQRNLKVANKINAIGENEPLDERAIILETYAKTMQRYLSEKAFIPERHLIEIAYKDLIRQPIPNLRKIYASLQLDNFGSIEDKMKANIANQRSFVRLRHALPAREEKAVFQKMAPFIRHWNYPIPIDCAEPVSAASQLAMA